MIDKSLRSQNTIVPILRVKTRFSLKKHDRRHRRASWQNGLFKTKETNKIRALMEVRHKRSYLVARTGVAKVMRKRGKEQSEHIERPHVLQITKAHTVAVYSCKRCAVDDINRLRTISNKVQ